MTTRDIDRLMDNARVHLPGATEDNIKLELFNVLDDFFQNSNIWQERIVFCVRPNDCDYSIAPSDVSTINRLLLITNSSSQPVRGSMAEPGEIILDYPPSQEDKYTALVALTINEPVTQEGFPKFPSWIMNKYGVDLVDGVVGRMMAQPAKPYSSERLAIFHSRKFRGAVAQAKFEAQHLNVYRGQAWWFPQSFNTRSSRRSR